MLIEERRKEAAARCILPLRCVGRVESWKQHASCPTEGFIVQQTSREPICIPECDANVYFERPQKDLATTFLYVCSIFSLLAATFTALSILVDLRRYRYPQRAILFLALTSIVYAAVSVLRLCLGYAGVSCEQRAGHRVQVRVVEGVESEVQGWCLGLFVLAYYSMLSAILWWLSLARMPFPIPFLIPTILFS